MSKNSPRDGFNTSADGLCRTLKTTYHKISQANFEHQDGLGATGVIETVPVYGNSRLNKMIADGKVNPAKTEFIDAYNQRVYEDSAATITTRIDRSNHYMISESTEDNGKSD
jgi:hypothetical protein